MDFFVSESSLNVKQLMTVCLFTWVTDNTDRSIPLSFFGLEQIFISGIFDHVSLSMDSLTNLMVVSSFEIFHVLSVINLSISHTSDLSTGFSKVLR